MNLPHPDPEPASDVTIARRPCEASAARPIRAAIPTDVLALTREILATGTRQPTERLVAAAARTAVASFGATTADLRRLADAVAAGRLAGSDRSRA